MANYTWPSVSIAAAPIQYLKDGSAETVAIDTVTPALSSPLPVITLDSSGNPVSPLDPTTIEGYLQTIATDTTAMQPDVAILAAVDYATHAEQVLQTTNLQNINNNQVSVFDSFNSSTAPLGIGGVFTGILTEVVGFSSISVAAFSDVDSAAGGLSMQFSPDGTNWDHKHNFDVVGGVGVSYNQSAELRYFRIVYTNGAVAQTTFRLTVVLKRYNTTPSKYTVGQAVNSNMMADLSKSVIWGLSTAGGGTYHTVKVKPSGALAADVSGSTVAATQSGTWNINNISGTVSLPTGAATETTLSSIDTKVVTTANGIKVDGSAVTQPISATSLPLPTGAATLAEQQTQTTGITGISNKLPAAIGQQTSAASLSVVVASDQTLPTKDVSRTVVERIFLDYSVSNVTTSAYTQLSASRGAITNRLEIFDSSGETLILAIGGAGSELDQIYVYPGGNGVVDLSIGASTRISIKAKTATASEGYIAMNLYS